MESIKKHSAASAEDDSARSGISGGGSGDEQLPTPPDTHSHPPPPSSNELVELTARCFAATARLRSTWRAREPRPQIADSDLETFFTPSSSALSSTDIQVPGSWPQTSPSVLRRRPLRWRRPPSSPHWSEQDNTTVLTAPSRRYGFVDDQQSSPTRIVESPNLVSHRRQQQQHEPSLDQNPDLGFHHHHIETVPSTERDLASIVSPTFSHNTHSIILANQHLNTTQLHDQLDWERRERTRSAATERAARRHRDDALHQRDDERARATRLWTRVLVLTGMLRAVEAERDGVEGRRRLVCRFAGAMIGMGLMYAWWRRVNGVEFAYVEMVRRREWGMK